MKRSTTIAATVFGLSLALASEAIAVPVTTAFTARIADGTGPVNGLVNLNFKIFDAATAGTMVWEEMHTGVSADEGLVYVALGSIAPTTNGLDETVFTGSALFLEVTVNGDVQTPRVPILSVPYATHAATADTLGSLAPGDVALSNHNHTGVYAPASHTHSEYALTTHNHTGVYAPASHTHSEYALTTHDHAGVYAPAAHTHSEYALTSHTHSQYALTTHTHSAADITAGTLDNARFSAYSDLTAEGRLDDNASTDILTRAQGDARWGGGAACTWVSGTGCSLGAAAGSTCTTSVTCPAGTVPVGGGCDGFTSVAIGRSQRTSNGWNCYYQRHTTITVANTLAADVCCQ